MGFILAEVGWCGEDTSVRRHRGNPLTGARGGPEHGIFRSELESKGTPVLSYGTGSSYMLLGDGNTQRPRCACVRSECVFPHDCHFGDPRSQNRNERLIPYRAVLCCNPRAQLHQRHRLKELLSLLVHSFLGWHGVDRGGCSLGPKQAEPSAGHATPTARERTPWLSGRHLTQGTRPVGGSFPRPSPMLPTKAY